MLLAAGRGERMQPLTLSTPKPLLEVGGAALLDWHLRRLAPWQPEAVVINVSYLGQQIEDFVGDGSRWGLRIRLSREPEPLETAGGILQALPLLSGGAFAVINADVYTDYPLASLEARLPPARGAHLVLVDNPQQHPAGDFALQADGRVGLASADAATFTFAGIAVYQPDFFAGIHRRSMPLRPLFDRAIAAGCLHGEHYSGDWVDVGTPQRLAELDQRLRTLHPDI